MFLSLFKASCQKKFSPAKIVAIATTPCARHLGQLLFEFEFEWNSIRMHVHVCTKSILFHIPMRWYGYTQWNYGKYTTLGVSPR
jgi:hypothetical protein